MAEFPPIYCMTLRDYFFRRTATQKQFNEHGLEVTWVEGINGTSAGIRPAVAHDYHDDGTPIYIHPKVLAICLSHVWVLQWAIAKGEQEFFIMEDDIVLCEGFKEKWATVRKHIPEDIQVVQCAVTCHEDKPTEPINEYIEHRYYPFCCTCNWWRKSGAEAALQTMQPFNSPCDVIYADRVFPFIGHAVTKEPLAWDHSVMGASGKWPSSYPIAIERHKCQEPG